MVEINLVAPDLASELARLGPEPLFRGANSSILLPMVLRSSRGSVSLRLRAMRRGGSLDRIETQKIAREFVIGCLGGPPASTDYRERLHLVRAALRKEFPSRAPVQAGATQADRPEPTKSTGETWPPTALNALAAAAREHISAEGEVPPGSSPIALDRKAREKVARTFVRDFLGGAPGTDDDKILRGPVRRKLQALTRDAAPSPSLA